VYIYFCDILYIKIKGTVSLAIVFALKLSPFEKLKWKVYGTKSYHKGMDLTWTGE
jgi:hypothetical protein